MWRRRFSVIAFAIATLSFGASAISFIVTDYEPSGFTVGMALVIASFASLGYLLEEILP